MPTKARFGHKIKALRRQHALTQAQMASELAISASYLNLIEHDKRPLSAAVLRRLVQRYDLSLESFTAPQNRRLLAQLHEVFGDAVFANQSLNDAELDAFVSRSPQVAQGVLRLYKNFRELRESVLGMADQLNQALLPGLEPVRLPSEEVSDYIERHENHFPELEQAAEKLWSNAGLEPGEIEHGLIRYLRDKLSVSVEVRQADAVGRALRRYEHKQRRLIIADALLPSSRAFQLAYQTGLLAHAQLIERLSDETALSAKASRALCRVALANYFAGAVLMPYAAFIEATRNERYDIELIGNRFGCNFEQVCHRMTTLRRHGDEGIPFHFVRSDIAGNISKRYSGSGIQIARFGGSCPRWNLHTAFLTPGQITLQLSRTSDNKVYFCLARTVSRQARGFHVPRAIQAITLGCEITHAHQLVYADGFDLDKLDAAVPIGSTCRLCEQLDCEQRVFPALHHPLVIDENVRGVSFYAPLR